MVKKINRDEQVKLGIMTDDFNVPKDHIARFVVDFIDEYFPILNIKESNKKKGRNAFSVKSMIKLLIFAKINHADSAEFISEMAKYHDLYRFVCDGITPSERSIQRYRNEYGKYFEVLLQITLKKAYDDGLTKFNHITIDGTIKKALNSNNNAISKKETEILLKYFKGVYIDDETLDKLHKPAQRIIDNKNRSDEDKLELLYDINTQFKLTTQDKIPVNDIEARFMKGKKGNFLIAYNIQSAVDYDTKLICAINVTQNPTDHYELPAIADKAINNTNKVPEYMSADTIYLNQISLSYFADKGIDGLIPTRKQSKEKIGKLNPNPYHKDHFTYMPELDAFKCPNNEYLFFYKQYTQPNKDETKPDTVKRLYNNYNVCKHCKSREKCIQASQTHKTITEYGSQMQKAMQAKMEKEEYKEEYAKRSSVEGPFGILKEQYQIEKENIIGMIKTEERLNLDAVAYNLKRLYNIKQEIKNNKEDIIDFCESIATTHQLKLDVTCY